MRIHDNFRYRPEIDGLRAVAVMVVLLFHAGLGCPGGYVGVDVFFVISGFLITSLIWKDLESGSFTFAQFWERRARRIIPALVVVTLATLVAGWFLLLPGDFKSLGQATVAQAVFAANIHYWRDAGYFAGAASGKPLLHTWSLAVEEQFYLIVPFLLWGMFRSKVLRSQATVVAMLVAGIGLSFALSIYGVEHSPSAAFYLLPTRAWELLLGALVAFRPMPPALQSRQMLREVGALAGLALILVPVCIYDSETPFPGLAALFPCLGAALVIWANERSDSKGLTPVEGNVSTTAGSNAPTVVGTFLSLRPVVFVGLISYSLYLWHWPLLAYSTYLLTPAPIPLDYRVALLICGFLCAILSWKYVETPFRKRQLGASRQAMFSFAGAGLAVVLGGGLVCVARQGFPRRFSAQVQQLASEKSDMAFMNSLTLKDINAGKLVPLGVRNPALRPTVLVWGDSHAMAALPAVDAFLQEKGLAGRAATHISTPPVLDWFTTIGNPKWGMGRHSSTYNHAVLSYIQSQHIPNVILIAHWAEYAGANAKTLTKLMAWPYMGNGDKPSAFDAALLKTVRRLVALGARPWIMLDIPNQSFDVPSVLAHHLDSPDYMAAFCAKPTPQDELETSDPKIFSAIKAAGGRIIDPKPRFLDPTGTHYIVQAKGVPLYRDDNHLSTKGAKLILLPFLRASLAIGK